MLSKPKEDAYRKSVLLARQMSGAEKMAEGHRLFVAECATIRDEIRQQHSSLGKLEIDVLMGWRLSIEEFRDNLSAGLSYRALMDPS